MCFLFFLFYSLLRGFLCHLLLHRFEATLFVDFFSHVFIFVPFSPLRLFCFFSNLFFHLSFLDLVLLLLNRCTASGPTSSFLLPPSDPRSMPAGAVTHIGHRCTMPVSHASHRCFFLQSNDPEKNDVSALPLPTYFLDSLFSLPWSFFYAFLS
jgi:hypothetical protein